MTASPARSVAESAAMSKDRKEIYLGEALRRALQGRKDSLTTVVNLIADRYLGIIERTNTLVFTVREEDVYRGVLAEARGRRLEAREIATFPEMVRDWLARNPDYPDSAYARVKDAPFAHLVALVDRLERDQ
jgi:hypothetical protein